MPASAIPPRLGDIIADITGSQPVRSQPMGGGCISDVRRITLQDGRTIVAKTGDPGSGLELEGMMLKYLRDKAGLPVPDVLYALDGLLLMDHLETSGGLTDSAQEEAAELLAALHEVTADTYGFEMTTLIGGLKQPNPPSDCWLDFFREQRLLYMAREAMDAGRLPPGLMGRIEQLAGRLGDWIGEPDAPSLVHGDMWAGNVLCHQGGIAGFVDPAIYYADSEVELAFSTLFSTFGEPFFRRYTELRPIRPGFYEERLALYNLYPLLVHVRLFGGSYVGSVERTIGKYGC